MNDAVLPELLLQLFGENIVIVLLAIAIIFTVILDAHMSHYQKNNWLNALVECAVKSVSWNWMGFSRPVTNLSKNSWLCCYHGG